MMIEEIFIPSQALSPAPPTRCARRARTRCALS